MVRIAKTADWKSVFRPVPAGSKPIEDLFGFWMGQELSSLRSGDRAALPAEVARLPGAAALRADLDQQFANFRGKVRGGYAVAYALASPD